MTDELRTRIRHEIDETTWTPLAMHAKRDALFFVAATLDLADVAYALATNRAPIVAHWIESGLLRRPSSEECAALASDAESHRFRFVIVQPFVVATRST